MDWTEIPSGLGKNMDVAMWHQVVQDHQEESVSLPDLQSNELGKIITVWQNENGQSGKIVEFTHGNFVSAIAGLIAALPARQRITNKDVLLSVDSWTSSYALCQTLAALFSGASLAISTVAGADVDLTFASKNIAPTIVISSSDSVMKLHADAAPNVKSGLAKISPSLKSNTLAGGNLPTNGGALASLTSASQSAIGSSPGTLRLLFVSEKAGTSNPPVSSLELNDLRLFTGARVVYALTAPTVAGAISQTNAFDYRVDSTTSKSSHFGAPLSSVEVKLIDSGIHKTTDETPKGEVRLFSVFDIEMPLTCFQITVYGPAVAGKEAKLGVVGTFRPDCTLAYA
jgi:hypothetical protein